MRYRGPILLSLVVLSFVLLLNFGQIQKRPVRKNLISPQGYSIMRSDYVSSRHEVGPDGILKMEINLRVTTIGGGAISQVVDTKISFVADANDVVYDMEFRYERDGKGQTFRFAGPNGRPSGPPPQGNPMLISPADEVLVSEAKLAASKLASLVRKNNQSGLPAGSETSKLLGELIAKGRADGSCWTIPVLGQPNQVINISVTTKPPPFMGSGFLLY